MRKVEGNKTATLSFGFPKLRRVNKGQGSIVASQSSTPSLVDSECVTLVFIFSSLFQPLFVSQHFICGKERAILYLLVRGKGGKKVKSTREGGALLTEKDNICELKICGNSKKNRGTGRSSMAQWHLPTVSPVTLSLPSQSRSSRQMPNRN